MREKERERERSVFAIEEKGEICYSVTHSPCTRALENASGTKRVQIVSKVEEKDDLLQTKMKDERCSKRGRERCYN